MRAGRGASADVQIDPSLFPVSPAGYFMGHKVHDFHLALGQVPNFQKVKITVFSSLSHLHHSGPPTLSHIHSFNRYFLSREISALMDLTL